MSEGTAVAWCAEVGDFRGEAGASLRVSGDRWIDLGARFDGGRRGTENDPSLALGAATRGDVTWRFGILDFGLDATYLLVPNSERVKESTSAVIAALTESGFISADDVIDDVGAPGTSKDELSERMGSVETIVVDLLSAIATHKEPLVTRARVIDVLPAGSRRLSTHVSQTHDLPNDLDLWAAQGSGKSRIVVLKGFLRRANQEGFGIFRPEDSDRDLWMHFDVGMNRQWKDLLFDAQSDDAEAPLVSVEVSVPEKIEE